MPSAESYPFQVIDRFASFAALQGWGVYGDDLPDSAEWVWVLGPQAPASDVTCVNVTPSSPVYLRADVMLGVQLKWRGVQDADPWSLADRVQQVTDWAQPNGHPRSTFAIGDLRFGRVNVSSSLVLGPDSMRRPQATLNLEFHARRVARTVPIVTPVPVPDADGLYDFGGTPDTNGLISGGS